MMTDDIRQTLRETPGQLVAQNPTLTRALRQEILAELENYSDGLGFNELHEKVDDIISRQTLGKRLDEYIDKDLVEIQGEPVVGQKKVYQLSEKGEEPDIIEETYEETLNTILPIWSEALREYNKKDFNRQEVLHYVLRHRLAHCIIKTVAASKSPEYSVSVDDLDPIVDVFPVPSQDQSVTAFYEMIGGELLKFYTENVFGVAYVNTRSKATTLRKDVMIKTYKSTVDFIRKRDKIWTESDVPTPENHITKNSQ